MKLSLSNIRNNSVATAATTCLGRVRIGVETTVGPILAQAFVTPPAANARFRKRTVSPEGMSAAVFARTKTRRVDALGAVAAIPRDKRVTLRILDDAAVACVDA